MLSKEKAMDGVRLFVFDMDGTVYLGDQPIEGSIEFIREVEATMKTVEESDVEPTCIYESLDEMRKYM